jgi:hypothetical protein
MVLCQIAAAFPLLRFLFSFQICNYYNFDFGTNVIHFFSVCKKKVKKDYRGLERIRKDYRRIGEAAVTPLFIFKALLR